MPFLNLRNCEYDVKRLLRDCLAVPGWDDLEIVCEDGVLAWNSVLMTMWSNVVRAFVREDTFQTRGDKIRMMIPDTKMATMKSLLDLSIKGQVSFSTKTDADKVMLLFKSLGMTADISVIVPESPVTGANDKDNLDELGADTTDGDGHEGNSGDYDNATPMMPLTPNDYPETDDYDGFVDDCNDYGNELDTDYDEMMDDADMDNFESTEDPLAYPDMSYDQDMLDIQDYLGDQVNHDTDISHATNKDGAPLPTMQPMNQNSQLSIVPINRLTTDKGSRMVENTDRINSHGLNNSHIHDVNDGNMIKLETNVCLADQTELTGPTVIHTPATGGQAHVPASLHNPMPKIIPVNIRSRPEIAEPKDKRMSKKTPNKACNAIKCMLCEGSYRTLQDLLKHLSRTHYHKKLLSLFGNDTSSCPICKFVFSPSSKAFDRTLHLGSAHKQIMSVAHQAVRDQLNYLRTFCHPSKIDRGAWGQCQAYFGSKQGCCKNFTSSLEQLCYHLASIHCADGLVSAYGKANSFCKCCGVGMEHVAKDREEIILHMVSSHLPLVFTLMPEYDANMLSQCWKKEKNSNESMNGSRRRKKLEKENGTELPTNSLQMEQNIEVPINSQKIEKFKVPENSSKVDSRLIAPKNPSVIEKNPKTSTINTESGNKSLKETMGHKTSSIVPGNYKCPMCDSLFGNLLLLKCHLSRVHFKKELLDHANIGESMQKCPDCSVEIRNSSRPEPSGMLKHLGVVHGYLDKVLPETIKAALEQMGPTGSTMPNDQRSKKDIPKPAIKPKGTKSQPLKLTTDAKGQIGCPHCPRKYNMPYDLKCHLATRHYCLVILKTANANSVGCRQCPVCSKAIGGDSYHKARHLGLTHGYLKKVLPEDLGKAVFGQSKPEETTKVAPNETREPQSIIQPCRSRRHPKPTIKMKFNNINKSKARDISISKPPASVSVVTNRGLVACPQCPSKYDSLINLKCHLASSHYYIKILKAAKVTRTGSGECQLCHKVVGRGRYKIARHLGLSHGFLKTVMPQEYRVKLFGQVQLAAPSTGADK